MEKNLRFQIGRKIHSLQLRDMWKDNNIFEEREDKVKKNRDRLNQKDRGGQKEKRGIKTELLVWKIGFY